MSQQSHLNILGTRGIPASHGGFETFAERLALYLVGQGRSVTVYCQSDRGNDLKGRQDNWRGIQRVHFGTKLPGALGTIDFDLKCTRHVLGQPGVDLVLGYNTAMFTALQKRRGRNVFMNMDGIEWQRKKWGWPARKWLKANEWLGAKLCNQPIADHPEIGAHILGRTGRSCSVIPYGADAITRADPQLLEQVHPDLRPGNYFVSIARIEPENSLLEIVQAYAQSGIGQKLLVLGNMSVENAFHRKLRQAANDNVIFSGGIYDAKKVSAIRFHARAYMHGHQVGGTNPSLVEALGAGNAVIAHANKFNKWTAGADQFFFADVAQCRECLARLSVDDLALHRAQNAARARHRAAFLWSDVLAAYRDLMLPVDQQMPHQIAAE